jgi:Na+-driven multidrug efflux pump
MKRKASLKEHILRQLRLKDTWVILFISGFVMMNYPFLSIFNKPLTLFGAPLLYVYLQVGWFFSIFIAYLFARSVSHHKDREDRH